MSYSFVLDKDVYFNSHANPWHFLFDWVRQDVKELQEIGDRLAEYNQQKEKECKVLGPIPSEAFGYEDLYAPHPHYVSCYMYSSEPSQPNPMDPVFQDSQDPYEDFTQLSLFTPGTSTQTPQPKGLHLSQPISSQDYPPYCTQDPAHEAQESPEYYQSYSDSLYYVRTTLYDTDNDNLSPNNDHEPICKR